MKKETKLITSKNCYMMYSQVYNDTGEKFYIIRPVKTIDHPVSQKIKVLQMYKKYGVPHDPISWDDPTVVPSSIIENIEEEDFKLIDVLYTVHRF